ncbi:MAG: SH3 domain-containing protein [Clostridia bacterium]
MRLAALLALGIALTAASAPASQARASDFRAVGEDGAILYDAPSRQATPLFVVSKGYPLEVIAQTDAWLKVRDAAGALSWVERRRLADRRTVVVTAPSAEVRQRPDDAAPVAFVAAKDVALDYIDAAPNGWVHVRHADGADGYLRAGVLWGD